MLEHVRGGRATVDEVRDTLLALTQEPSKKSGCCPDCDDAIGDYAAAAASCERARARFDDAETYPYLVSQSATHTWDCYHFAGRLPEGVGSSVSDFVHNVRPGGLDRDLTRLTADEALTCMTERTGPKGGLRWRRCRTCQPALPGAWESESNDVPTGGNRSWLTPHSPADPGRGTTDRGHRLDPAIPPNRTTRRTCCAPLPRGYRRLYDASA